MDERIGALRDAIYDLDLDEGEWLSALAAGFRSMFPDARFDRIMSRAPTTGAYSDWSRTVGESSFWSTFSAAGRRFGDFVGLRAVDGGERFIGVSAWYDAEQSTPATTRAALAPIAAHMRTVPNQLQAAYRKLGVSDRMERARKL